MTYLPSDADANDGSPRKAAPYGMLHAVALASAPSFRYVRQALTLAEFAAYVQSYDFGSIPPSYLVIHHTAIPSASWAPAGDPAKYWDAGEQGMTLAQIRDKRLRQLDGIKNYYQQTLRWSAGPHLFVDDHWVYLMTPMYDVGIHAAQGNSTLVNGRLAYSLGIEVVGDYTHVAWPPAIQVMVRAVVQMLHDRLGTFQLQYKAGPGYIAGHRAYNKPSCPGDAVTNDLLIQTVTRAAAPASQPPDDTLSTPLPYLGIDRQAISAATFAAVLTDHQSPLAPFADAIYEWIDSLDIAADVWLAQAAKESSFMTTGLSRTNCNPLNIRQRGDYPGRGGFADYRGAPWLGALWSLCHLKLMYGQVGLTTLEQIVPIFAPAGDGDNNPAQYIAVVRQTVAAIRKREAAHAK